MRPYKVIVFIFLSIISLHCAGQTKLDTLYTAIQVGSIPDLSLFRHLTKYEIKFDSLMQAQNKTSLKMMLDGKYFIKGTPKELIDSALQQQKVLSTIRYKENRSRYVFQNFKNGHLLNETKNYSGLNSVGTECSCILDNDTLKIGMGIWIFGGFAFSIEIVDNKFTSSYWLDEHKRRIFKLKTSDTLSEDLLIPFVEQQLMLDTLPAYKSGQQLTGYLSYKTTNYLRASDFEDWEIKNEYNGKKMDTIYTKGIIHFTCKVRQKLQRDE